MSQTQFQAQISDVIESVTQYRDQGQWQKLEQYFTDTPYIDDQVVTKEQPGKRPVGTVMYIWRRMVRELFYGMRHSLGNLKIERKSRKEAAAESEAEARLYSIDKNERYVTTLKGTYKYQLVKVAGRWKISDMRFLVKQRSIALIGA